VASLKRDVRAIGAVVARFVHTEEVTGSNPVSPTSKFPSRSGFTSDQLQGMPNASQISNPPRPSRSGSGKAASEPWTGWTTGLAGPSSTAYQRGLFHQNRKNVLIRYGFQRRPAAATCRRRSPRSRSTDPGGDGHVVAWRPARLVGERAPATLGVVRTGARCRWSAAVDQS